MRIPSNKIDDVISFFYEELEGKYTETEIKSFVFQAFERYTFRNKANLLADRKTGRLSESEMLSLFRCIKELRKYKPIQYILEETEWFGLQLYVNESVLIPRPETEELAFLISEEDKELNPEVIWDICTGSGCLALAMKKSFPYATVFATDISEEALKIAKKNSELTGYNVIFFQYDLFDSLKYQSLTKPQIIVSNPPYVLESQKKDMQHNVLDWEPHLALFVEDTNPLSYYHALKHIAIKNLPSRGKIYMEINENFASETAALFEDTIFCNINIIKDFRGKNRFLTAIKR